MRPKDFARLVARDGYCLHCGQTEAISPNHRANRGMGGSKARDVPSNLVVLCSEMNSIIESNAFHRAKAIEYGWKLNSWDVPSLVPVHDLVSGESWILDDEYSRKIVVEKKKEL